MTNVFLTRLDSPIGRIELVGDDDAVTALSIEREGALPHDGEPERSNDVLDAARAQLLEYFAGDRTDFDVPVRLTGTAVPAGRVGRARAPRLGRSHFIRRPRRRGRQARVGPGDRRRGRREPHADHRAAAIACSPPTAASPATRGGDGIPTKLWLLGHERIGFAA